MSGLQGPESRRGELPPHLQELQRTLQAGEQEKDERRLKSNVHVSTPLLRTVLLAGGTLALGLPLTGALLTPTGFADWSPALGSPGIGPGLTALIVGFVFLRFQVIRLALDRMRTATATGLVTDAKLEGGRSTRGGRTWRLRVHFQYEPDRMSDTVEVVYYPRDGSHNIAARHEADMELFKPGTAMDVRFDPSNPLNAAIGPRTKAKLWPFLVFFSGTLFFGAGIYMLAAPLIALVR